MDFFYPNHKPTNMITYEHKQLQELFLLLEGLAEFGQMFLPRRQHFLSMKLFVHQGDLKGKPQCVSDVKIRMIFSTHTCRFSQTIYYRKVQPYNAIRGEKENRNCPFHRPEYIDFFCMIKHFQKYLQPKKSFPFYQAFLLRQHFDF